VPNSNATDAAYNEAATYDDDVGEASEHLRLQES